MYIFDILEINTDLEIVFRGKKNLYAIKNEDRADCFCNYGNSEKKIQYPNLCGLNVRDSHNLFPENSLSFMSYEQNSVRGNGESIYIQSAVGHRNRGVYLNTCNFFDVCSVFSAKRLIDGNWVNWYDEYVKPNIKDLSFLQFKYDSIIYSTFNIKSHQSSLRQVTYMGKLWDIKNEFFWMSAERMKELADNNGYDNLYNDARTSPNRHVYNLLFGEDRIYDKLSPDAKAVLDKATELVEKSIKMRMIMSNDENHLDSWDAGYAQLKLVWKEYFSDDFKEFRQLYKNMEDRMRPLVYELGFLMN